MTRTPSGVRWLAAGCVVLVAACGGGGGGSGSGAGQGGPTTNPAPTVGTETTLQGTAATGAPLGGATVTVIDKREVRVANATVAADGSYTVTLPAGVVPPFVLTASRDDETLVSVGTAASGTVNITPITNLLASRLSASGNPTKLASELAAGSATVDDATVASKLAEIVDVIQPVRDAIGDTIDPLKGSFKADGTGADRLLDSLLISIAPRVDAPANVQIQVKQPADPATANAVSFTSPGPAPTRRLAPVAASALPEPGTAQRIADLLDRITACYALPVGSRTASNGTGADAVSAVQCRGLFLNDDPATYLSNGSRVGSGGSFSGIFRADAMGVKFHRGAFVRKRVNGDVVLRYAFTDAAGNTSFDTLVARQAMDAAGRPVLKLVGNQYAYPGGVIPYHQFRQFFTLNQSASSYYSSGYSLRVANVVDSGGRPVFDRVEVTSPTGAVMILKPSAGGSLLNLVRTDGSISGTPVVRLGRAYADASNGGDPADRDTSLFFSTQRYTDAEIEQFREQAVWTFRYYLASAPATLAATQTYVTLARALSIAELRTRNLATLTPASLTSLQALANPTTGNFAPLPPNGPLTVSWQVPSGALPVTLLELIGRHQGGTFNDTATVTGSSRSGSIPCVAQTSADAHCAGSGFASSAVGTGLSLFAREHTGREFANFYAAYGLR